MSAKKRRTGALPKRSPQRGPDGYIIERNGQIRKLRQTIRAKYGVTLLVVIFIFIWSFAIAVYQWQSPERWTRAEIVYSHLSLESIGIRRGLSYVLHSADGSIMPKSAASPGVRSITSHGSSNWISSLSDIYPDHA